MKTAVLAITVCAVIIFQISTCSAIDKKSRSVDEHLIGTWRVMDAKYNGLDDPMLLDVKVTFTDKLMISRKGGKTTTDKYSIDLSKTPKWITINVTRKDGSHTLLGIYSISKKKLVICHGDSGDPRPDSFRTKAEDKRSLGVLVKVKKKKGARKKEENGKGDKSAP